MLDSPELDDGKIYGKPLYLMVKTHGFPVDFPKKTNPLKHPMSFAFTWSLREAKKSFDLPRAECHRSGRFFLIFAAMAWRLKTLAKS